MEINRICGYHGTTTLRANEIIRKQDFVDSARDNDWLGTGVYFFAYIGHAKWWIEAERYQKRDTCILSANLEYRTEQLLDLDDPEVLSVVEDVVREAVKIANETTGIGTGVNLEKGHPSKKWNFACNTYKKICPQIGIITYTFTTPRKFEYIGYTQTQKQICVSDHSIIKDIKKI